MGLKYEPFTGGGAARLVQGYLAHKAGAPILLLPRPGVELRANLKSISHKCFLLFEVAFAWQLTKETIHLPMGCLQGGEYNWARHKAHCAQKLQYKMAAKIHLRLRRPQRARPPHGWCSSSSSSLLSSLLLSDTTIYEPLIRALLTAGTPILPLTE